MDNNVSCEFVDNMSYTKLWTTMWICVCGQQLEFESGTTWIRVCGQSPEFELWVRTMTWIMSLDNNLSYDCGQQCEFQVFGQRCEFECLDNNVYSSVWKTWLWVFGQRDFECLDKDVSLSVWTRMWVWVFGVGTMTWVCSGDNDVSLQWGQWRESAPML